MARKRLTPAQPDYLSPAPAAVAVPASPRAAAPLILTQPAPIAQVAGEASATAALQELSATVASARAEGRFLHRVALEQIDVAHLVRDRMAADEDDLAALIDSIRSHGQRSPIEITQIGPDRYGLISGWRRVMALARLHAETGEARFGAALAMLRSPASAEAAYVAMVEENEVRAGLSYYERARIAAKAVELGVFSSEKQALQRLFSTASRAKRSKIGSFLTICHALDADLRFPSALPERLGLALAKRLETDPDSAGAIRAALAAAPPAGAEEEQRVLARCLVGPVRPSRAAPEEVRPGLFLSGAGSSLTLSGPEVGPDLRAALRAWLRAR